MRRVVEVCFLVGVAVAVLAFGGTAPQFFAITQGIVLGLGILQLAAGRRSTFNSVPFPVAVPCILIALVLLQITPLPVFLAPAFEISVPDGPGHTYFTISAAPYETVSHLLLLVTYLTAFYLVLVLCEERNARKRLVFALLAIGVFEAFYGLIQYLTGWQQIFAYVKKFYLEDATGTYINRNHFAGLLEMILPFAVVFALQQVRALRRRTPEDGAQAKRILSSKEFPLLVFWFFVAALLFTTLFFSGSRMGIISALVSLLAVLTLSGTAALSARTRIVVGVLFLLGISGLAVWIGSDPVIRRFETLGQQYNQPGHDRISIWRDTLRLIRRHPLLGTGLGTFGVVYPSVQTAFLNNFVDHAHNDYLQIASELGLPGAILVFGTVFWVLGLTVRRCRKSGEERDKAVSYGCLGSITAILLHSLTDFNLYIPANGLVFVIILALAWSNAQSAARWEAAPITHAWEEAGSSSEERASRADRERRSQVAGARL
jgi:O-antigen ligase